MATWVYDNSIHNKANPDPKRDVTWGEQTPDEMMYFRVNYRWVDETVAHPRNDLQAKLMSSVMMGALDTNLDGKLELSEPASASLGSRIARPFFGRTGQGPRRQPGCERDGAGIGPACRGGNPGRHAGNPLGIGLVTGNESMGNLALFRRSGLRDVCSPCCRRRPPHTTREKVARECETDEGRTGLIGKNPHPKQSPFGKGYPRPAANFLAAGKAGLLIRRLRRHLLPARGIEAAHLKLRL